VSRARAGQGPTLVEGRTYRYYDHSLGLGRIVRESYRTEEEVDQWKLRDPIDVHKALLLSQGFATQAEIDEVEAEVAKQIADAVAFARQSPYPDPDDLYDDLYAEPIAAR
jgi:pyruvate dehydrogenase E1 component alpha subunit